MSSCTGTCPCGHNLWSGPRTVWSRSLPLWSLWLCMAQDTFRYLLSLSSTLSFSANSYSFLGGMKKCKLLSHENKWKHLYALGPVSAYTYLIACHMKTPSAALEPGLGSRVRSSPLSDPQASQRVILPRTLCSMMVGGHYLISVDICFLQEISILFSPIK